MLIDKDHSDVLSFLREALEGPFNLGGLCLGIDNQKVTLGFRRIGYVLYREKQPDISFSG